MNEFQVTVCQKWSKRCPKKAIPAKFARIDHSFTPIKEKDLEMEQLMAKMKAAGMGGMSMYSKDDMEDLASSGGFGADMYGDDPYGDGMADSYMPAEEPPISKSSSKVNDFEF